MDSRRGVVLKIEDGGRKKEVCRWTDHVIVVKVPLQIYRE